MQLAEVGTLGGEEGIREKMINEIKFEPTKTEVMVGYPDRDIQQIAEDVGLGFRFGGWIHRFESHLYRDITEVMGIGPSEVRVEKEV